MQQSMFIGENQKLLKSYVIEHLGLQKPSSQHDIPNAEDFQMINQAEPQIDKIQNEVEAVSSQPDLQGDMSV